ncbi:MAG: hypothetical protein OXQ29_18060 [Rhodospirillaceae bacterium]|nr:hypothetical protein [Rhodospirillaceae bacterium]
MAALVVLLPRSVERLVDGHPGVRQRVVDEAVRILRGRRSLWPIRTGRSIRGFRRTGSGADSRIYNPVRYASYVEEQNRRPAERTLRAARSRLEALARRLRDATARRDRDTGRALDARAAIIRAAEIRRDVEISNDLYQEYLVNLLAFRRRRRDGTLRNPPIPRALRELDERLLRLAGERFRNAS